MSATPYETDAGASREPLDQGRSGVAGEDVTRAPRGLPDYGDVLGYVVLVDDMHDGKFFGVPTEDHAEALRALRHYSNNGLTCFMGEVRRVESQPEKPAGGLT